MSKLFSFKTSSVLFPDIFLQQRVDVLCVGVGVGAAKEVCEWRGGGGGGSGKDRGQHCYCSSGLHSLKVFMKLIVLSVETILNARAHTHTHTEAPAHTTILTTILTKQGLIYTISQSYLAKC